MKTVYLIDGAFFCIKFRNAFNKYPSSSDVINFVNKVNTKYNNGNEYLRIYFYDCQPLDKNITLPISKNTQKLSKTQRYSDSINLIQDLKREDFISVREGFLRYNGWNLKKNSLKKINKHTFVDEDFKPNIEQKGVDIKIGLDIAWISLNKIAERIILVTGDSDFMPAMKFARRSGIQVFLSFLDHGILGNLKDHSDVLISDDITLILQ